MSKTRMSHARDAFRSRWSFPQRLIATTLLSLLPVSTAAAQPSPRVAPRFPSSAPNVSVNAQSPARPVSQSATEVAFFGPRKFVRTTGPKDVYTVTVTVPAWLHSPFRLHVQNGEANGTFRVSSATIEINNVTVLSQSDFNQNVAALDRTVTLAPTTTLKVTLASKPTSYLTLWFYGAPADHTPPLLTWVTPATASTINNPTPQLLVRYSDPVGTDEPAASGVNLASLKVFIDDVDLSEVITRRTDEASGDFPTDAPLAQGLHSYRAYVDDFAGNRREVTGQFRVDLTSPVMAFTTPADGAYLATLTPQVKVSYSDDVALDLTSIAVKVNDVLLTPGHVTAGPDLATIAVDPLPEGPNRITASIRDRGGNVANAAVSFNVDVTKPVIAIAQPAAGTRIGSHDVPLIITWSDAQGIVPATGTARLDGTTNITLVSTDDGATAQLTGVSDGAHTISATVADRAGNSGTTSVSFIVDTTVPVINVVAPPAGANVKSNTPQVEIHYSDDQGVVTNSLAVSINEVNQSALFTKTPTAATGQVATPLPEGTTRVAASIQDVTGNTASTLSTFVVDTIAPTGTIDAPGDRVRSATPFVSVSYADSGSGIDSESVALKVDGVAVTGVLSAGPDHASGTLDTPLADGPHTVQIGFADRATNPTSLSKSFVVDTIPPQITVAVPANDSFVNTPTPPLRVTYADPTGTGVDTATLHLFLRKGSDPEVDVTSYVTITPTEATGLVPAASPLADNTYRLRASIVDRAGNESSDSTSFEIDTNAPTVEVESPAANGYVNSSTPRFSILWSDALSGVDTSTVVILVDGLNRTDRFTMTATGATGQLAANQALAEGPHVIRVSLFDRAGNAAPIVEQTFTVDTIVPTVQIDAPVTGGYVGPAPYSFSASYADANGSGIAPAWVTIAIDGTDRSSQFTITPTAATASITTALTDGSHTMTVSVLDWAGNAATATSTFTVDAVAPVVTITAPATSSWNSGSSLQVRGTVVDASPLTLSVNGVQTVATSGAFTVTVPTTEGSFLIRAVATDAAGNVGTSEITVNVDSLPPVIHVDAPAAGFVTSASSFTLSGTVSDTSTVTLQLDGQPLALTSNAFTTSVPLTADGVKHVLLKATDQAGNSSTQDVQVTRDTVAPQVAVLSPGAGSVVGAVPVVVSGTLHDETATTVTVDGVAATVAGDSWQVSIGGLEEGPHSFAVIATDAAGNRTTVSRDVTIDLGVPAITIATPLSGTITKEATTNVTGTASDQTLVSVKIGALIATLQPGTTPNEKAFSFTGVTLTEGDNTLTAIATDALGRTGQAAVLITRDSTPPVLTVDAPELITRTRPSHVAAVAQDNLALRNVVFQLGSTVLATQTTSPFGVDITAPSTAQPGDLLTLTVIATDTAGNATTVTKTLRVTSDGAVTGLVLSNVTGLPIAAARIRVAGDTHHTTTDARGRYALPANNQNLVLIIEAPESASAPMTVVERTVVIQSGVGTVPVDARLTPLGAAVSVGSGGGTLSATNLSVVVPGGAVISATPMHLTLIGAQGLPNLLPLGWRPVVAFDVHVDGTLAANVPFDATIGAVPNLTLHLAKYDTTLHAWTTVATNLTPAAGSIHTALATPGSFALIAADNSAVPAPVTGKVLTGVAMQPIPDNATSSGSVNPPTIPPTGGAAVGTLTVHSPDAALPSGTVVQAEVTETFTMSSGDLASEEKRMEDIVLFRDGNDISAEFPIVPSRTFTAGDLIEGRVHLDILAGREAVRGRTGGSQALTLTAGDIQVTVPAGSLPEDLAISATPTVLSSFLPSTSSVYPIAEVLLDFGGMALGNSAVLSVSASGASASDTVVIARVERVAGVPKVVAVAASDLVNGRFVSKDLGTLAGIRRDGRYVFYRLTIPWSLLSGTVGLPASVSSALVVVDGFPLVAITDANGDFSTIAPVGTAHLTASVPNTSLSGQATAQVVSGQVASANINLTALPTTATITPADGAIHVPRSAQIEIVATAPLRASSANGSTFTLRDSGGASVALRFVFSSSGRTLAIVPQALLEAGRTYTLTVHGLTDVYGGNVPVASITFTTEPETAPEYDTRKITFTMPGANGLVTVSAPPGSLPPGTRVMIVNAGNGIVVSFTVGNDGSFTGTFPATINDRLDVTITDPQGNIVQFTRSQFTATDGSGKTAIGPGGGVVEGPGGVELRIPEGALPEGAVFKIEGFGPEAYTERPDFAGAHFGSGLRITSEQRPTLKKEGDLVFTRPADAPAGSFFYIYRRIEGPNGQIAFQTIDQAFDDGHGKVVTASFPFIGWKDSTAAYQAQADLGGLAFGVANQVVFFMMWSWDALFPGLPVQGAIVGHVYRPVFDPGSSEPRYEPVAGALVTRVRENGTNVPISIAVTENDGHFVVWDSHYTGGTVDVEAHLGNDEARGTAFEANVSNTRANVFANLINTYGYAAEVNLTFPAQTAPPPSPDVEVRVMTLDQSKNLLRTEISGVVAAETPLLIGFKFRNNTQGEILNASINGEEFAVRRDDGGIGTGETMDFIVSTLYTPRNAGTYAIKATALNPLGGAPRDAEHTFLVVAGGGTNNAGIPNEPPDWITRKLVPKPNAIGVAVDVLPQVVFTEPVTNVVAGLEFTASSGSAPYKLSAAGLDATGHPRVIDDLRVEPADTKVTAITLVPLGGLDFGTTYTLRLTSAIKDTDTNPSTGAPAPRNFPDRSLTFTTIDPTPLGDASESFFAPAVAVIGDYAYVAKQTVGNGVMAVYDISDPEDIHEVGRNAVLGLPTHLVADAESPVNENGPMVAVGSGLKFNPPGPSNVYLFDVRNPAAPEKMGIITTNESAEDGIVLRLALRKSFLYTITFPKGIQVIDLQRATDAFRRASADPLARQRMYLDSVVAGRGFGQDAIVNTVRIIDPNTGFGAHLMDLAAAQYNVGGSNRTLVIATGSTPFVILDPSETTPRATSAPPTAQGALEFGRALTLTRIANRDLALMVGTGQARDAGGSLTRGTALYIYDMLNPLVPNLIGSMIVDDSASDVEVTGSTAVVATAGGAMTFSLADPAAPRYLGTVEGVGYRIAIGAEGGYLVSSGTTSQSSSGLHVASFKPVVIIKKADPVMIAINGSPGTVTAPQKVNAIDNLDVKIKVIPNVSGLMGTVTVSNKNFPRTDGSDGGSSNEDYPIVWTNLEKGEGRFTLPAGRQYEDSDLVANANVDSDNGTLRSVPRSIKLGWVRLELDSNNNTDIDILDREAARKGRAFAFWESDPFYDLKRIAKEKDAEKGEEEKGLADYFTIRITVNKLWRTDSGSQAVRLRMIKANGEDADWTIVKKVGAAHDYLRDNDTALKQVAAITAGSEDPTQTPECTATDTLIHTEGAGECRPPDAGVTLPPLAAGTYELLVRCRNCGADAPSTSADVPRMLLEYVASDSASSGTRIDEARADIRPVRQWITYVTARAKDPTNFKPLSYLDQYQRNETWYNDDPHEPPQRQRTWSNETPEWVSWASRVPLKARDVTVIVHGYKVSDSAMRNVFAPTMFKRLYWVGHPVLRLQGEWRKQEEMPGCLKNCAHTVAISWPSNWGGKEPYYNSFIAPRIREAVSDKWAAANFPEDEYRAFATGPGMALYLSDLYNTNTSRKIRIIAHSLGNLAVQAALSRPELAGHKIDRFIMNEAAFPAEAVAPVPVDENYLNLWGERHAEKYGFASDSIWQEDWDDRMGLLHKLWWKNHLRKLKNQIEPSAAPLNFPSDQDFYEMRWRQVRPSTGLPDYESTVQPDRGPWRGLFFANKDRARIFNTFSENDRVLRVIWRANQTLNKPFAMIRRVLLDEAARVVIRRSLVGDRPQDDEVKQKWGITTGTEQHWNSVFGSSSGEHWTIKRQWAELSYWFPATAGAAGGMNLDSYFNTQCNVDTCNTRFTEYSDYTGDPVLERWGPLRDTLYESVLYAYTHSYLGYGRFAKVYPAFEQIRKMFDPKN